MILEDKEAVSVYLRTVFALKPKFLAFDYKTTSYDPYGAGQRILVGSMCWQNNYSVAWEWKYTPVQLFREVMECADIGKIVSDRNFIRRWTRKRVRSTRVNGQIWEVSEGIFNPPCTFKFVDVAFLLENAANSSQLKYRIGTQEIINSGVLN